MMSPYIINMYNILVHFPGKFDLAFMSLTTLKIHLLVLDIL